MSTDATRPHERGGSETSDDAQPTERLRAALAAAAGVETYEPRADRANRTFRRLELAHVLATVVEDVSRTEACLGLTTRECAARLGAAVGEPPGGQTLTRATLEATARELGLDADAIAAGEIDPTAAGASA